MNITEAVTTVVRKYADFSGRARRAEYWWFTLAHSIVILVPYLLGAVFTALDVKILGGLLLAIAVILALGLIVPGLAVFVRRLHDTGRSGWWYFLGLVPFGSIVLLVFTCLDSTPGPNQFGPNPKGIGGFAPYGQVPPSPHQFGNPSSFG